MISNLIVDQTVENPAAMEMMSTVEGSYTFDHDNDPATPDRIFIPNVSPDVGLSAPFTGWFTLLASSSTTASTSSARAAAGRSWCRSSPTTSST